MKSRFQPIFGYSLIGAAILGMLLSLAGLIWLWSVKGPLTSDLLNKLDTAAEVLNTTSDGLSLTDQSLKTATSSTVALETTLQTLAKTSDDTGPMLDSLSALVGRDLPNSVSAAQASLDSAQSSAQIIDSVLRTITSLPLYPGTRYNPPVPLNVALAQVSASLDTLPDSFSKMEDSLVAIQSNLGLVKAEISLMTQNIRQINASLKQAQTVVAEYQLVVSNLQDSVERTKTNLPGQINLLAWIATIVLVWIAMTQVGLLLQGLELIRR